MKTNPIAYKVDITTTHTVYVYYPQGIVLDDEETKGETLDAITEMVMIDALDMADNEDGLVIVDEEDDENSNGFIAFVETFDPDVKIRYNIPSMPTLIKIALDAQLTPEELKDINIG